MVNIVENKDPFEDKDYISVVLREKINDKITIILTETEEEIREFLDVGENREKYTIVAWTPYIPLQYK